MNNKKNNIKKITENIVGILVFGNYEKIKFKKI